MSGRCVAVIERADDPRLADFVGLTDRDRREKLELTGGLGLFIVEGLFGIERLLQSRYPIRSLLLTPRRLDRLRRDCAGTPGEEVLERCTIWLASREILAAVTGYDVHRGALAAADRLPLPHPETLLERVTSGQGSSGSPGLVLVLEGISDNENLGALFRNAAGFGAGAVLLDPSSADPLYRRSVRVSVGNVLHVAYTRLAPWPESLQAVAAAGIALLALTPDPGAEPLSRAAKRVVAAAARLQVGETPVVGLLLGAEGPGLSAAALDAVGAHARIPLAGGVDSLNVATAAALACYELRRSWPDRP